MEVDQNQGSKQDPMEDKNEGYEETPVYHDISKGEGQKEQKKEREEDQMDEEK